MKYKTLRDTIQNIIESTNRQDITEATGKPSYPWFSGKNQEGWFNVNTTAALRFPTKFHDGYLQAPDIRPVLMNPSRFGINEDDIMAVMKADVKFQRGFKGVGANEDEDAATERKFNALLKGTDPIVNAPLTSMLYKMGWVSIQSTPRKNEFVIGTIENLKKTAAIVLKHFPNNVDGQRASLSMRTFGKSLGSAKDMHSPEEIQKFIGKS